MAEQARKVLENPLVQEAFANIENTIISKWRNEHDSRQRDVLWQQYQSMVQFKKLFEAAVTQGKEASMELDKTPVQASRFNTP